MWDDAAPPTMAERYAQTYGGQAYDAADKFSMSNLRGRSSSDDNIINAAQMREINQMQRNMAELNALSAQISTDRQLGNIEELGKAYGAAGYGPGDPYALPGSAAPSADRWIPGGPLPQDGGTVVGKRMSQAEMDAFDSQSGNYNAGSGLKLPGTSGMDEFGRGWSSRGSDWSVLEGDKPLSYSLGSGMRTSLGLVYDGLTGAESFNQAGRAWRAGNYGTAALYGMQGVGTAGLTAMTLGDYALAKAAVTGMAGSTGLRPASAAVVPSTAAVGLSSSRVVAPETVERYLIERANWSPVRARGYVDSFEGSISARISRPGEQNLRYFDGAEGSGNFLTRSEFFSPVDARKALNLDPALTPNLARSRQVVTTTERNIVFEGLVREGGLGIRQTVITDKNKFQFGPGYRYY